MYGNTAGHFAANTKVPVEQTKGEIERLVVGSGAEGFASFWQDRKASVAFRMCDRNIRFDINLPDPDDDAFKFSHNGRRRRSEADQEKAYNQACRQRWRALLLIIKGKLEAVAAGVVIFEEEFLAQTVMPDGDTVGAHILKQVDEAYRINGGARLQLTWRGE